MPDRAVIAALLIAGCGGGSGTVRPPTTQEDTTLGAGDVFSVRVYAQEQLSGRYRVATDGTIDFPFIGRTEVAGLEPPEVADLLARRLKEGEYLVDPHVSILVEEYNSKRVSVVGAVDQPGTFPLTPGMTVLRAITTAGGFTALASQNSTVVTRHTADGERRRYVVRAGDVSEGQAPDFVLQPNDIIYVPERVF